MVDLLLFLSFMFPPFVLLFSPGCGLNFISLYLFSFSFGSSAKLVFAIILIAISYHVD